MPGMLSIWDLDTAQVLKHAFLLFFVKSIDARLSTLIHCLAVVDVGHLVLPYIAIPDVLLLYLLSFRKLPKMLSG